MYWSLSGFDRIERTFRIKVFKAGNKALSSETGEVLGWESVFALGDDKEAALLTVEFFCSVDDRSDVRVLGTGEPGLA